MNDLEEFIKNVKFSKHCKFCEGIDDSIEDPKHHPSYEITKKCNLNCIFCYSRVAERSKTVPEPGYYGEMNPKVITISQYGEPFASGEKEVARIIDELRKIFGEVRIDIQTNGTYDLKILDGRADIVMISISAGKREKYAEICGVDAFPKVLENLKKVSGFAYTIVRTVYLPGINDSELVDIAKIAAEVDELFIQPVSVYRENLPSLNRLDFDRAESIYDFIKSAFSVSEIANIRLPGCFLKNLKAFLENYDFQELKFVKRNVFGDYPAIRRKRLFVL
ncbi:MAG: radical SAM protein [Archaeoglobales archaeon]|nr:radical SAM protein [Archaeoglobales archaeon]